MKVATQSAFDLARAMVRLGEVPAFVEGAEEIGRLPWK